MFTVIYSIYIPIKLLSFKSMAKPSIETPGVVTAKPGGNKVNIMGIWGTLKTFRSVL